jgi:ketosteroid isomerase-like protein
MHVLCTFAAILMLLSCTTPHKKNDTAAAIASRMFDAFNRHEWETMASHYSDSALFLDPGFGKEYVIQSREAIIEKYKALQRAFPDIHDQVVEMYPSGDSVITVAFISTGNAPNGTSFRLPIVTILTVKNGVIVKDATYYDVENP